jgi:hypothetical protein
MSSARWITKGLWPLVCLLTIAAARPAAPTPSEYEIKAIFLLQFAQYVEWPAGAFVEPRSPLVIGVLGADPFNGALEEAVAGETVDHRPLTIRRFRRVEEIKTCHVLFIGRSETERLEKIFAHLKGRNILTVGDSGVFAETGGMVQFISENKKIRFRINLAAAKAAGLTISSKILRVADVISPPEAVR